MLEWLKKIKDKKNNVHYLHTAYLPVERVLETCADAGLESLTVVGWDRNGKLFMATSYAKRKDVLWDMQLMSKEIME